jgi:predicted metal-dependent hydrolase
LSWIEKNRERVKNQERQPAREYVSGENHYFKGQRYRLQVIYEDIVPKVEIKGVKFINLYVRKGASTSKRAEILKEWYRSELKEFLPAYIEKWEKRLGVSCHGWEFKQMKTKWGSCNTRTQKLLFNLELMKKPTHCIEYIVVHELAHLLERTHNEKFQLILNTYFPQWEIYKEELNEFIV